MSNKNPNHATRFQPGNTLGKQNKGRVARKNLLKRELQAILAEYEIVIEKLQKENLQLRTGRNSPIPGDEILSEIKSIGDLRVRLLRNIAAGVEMIHSKSPADRKFAIDFSRQLYEFVEPKKKQIETTGEPTKVIVILRDQNYIINRQDKKEIERIQQYLIEQGQGPDIPFTNGGA